MASKPAFVSRAQRSASHKRVHARLRRAMASGALQTPISGLPEIGAQMCASRASPTCVDRYAPVSRWNASARASPRRCPPPMARIRFSSRGDRGAAWCRGGRV